MADLEPIRICEWSAISVSGLSLDLRRSIEAAVASWMDENDLPDSPLSFSGADGCVLSATHYVGVVEVRDAAIEIYPKLDRQLIDASAVSTDAAASSVMRHLLWMMEIAGIMDLAEADAAQLDVSAVSYYDLFAFLLAKNLLNELERGVMHSYVSMQDDVSTVRGRIDLLRQCTVNWGRYDVHHCRWDEFTPDTSMNRLLKCACRYLQPRVRNPIPARLLASCAALLDDVTDVDPGTAIRETRVRWDRSNDRFRRAFDMARRLLAGSAYEMATGTDDVFVFLLDMNVVFEAFVSAVVAARFGVPVVEQHPIGHLLFTEKRGCIQQIPDIQWTADRQAWIGDAKYKRLLDPASRLQSDDSVEGFALGAADVRQLTTYAGIAECTGAVPRLAVFHPSVAGDAPGVPIYRTWNSTHLCLVPVRIDKVQPAAEVLPSGIWTG